MGMIKNTSTGEGEKRVLRKDGRPRYDSVEDDPDLDKIRREQEAPRGDPRQASRKPGSQCTEDAWRKYRS